MEGMLCRRWKKPGSSFAAWLPFARRGLLLLVGGLQREEGDAEDESPELSNGKGHRKKLPRGRKNAAPRVRELLLIDERKAGF